MMGHEQSVVTPDISECTSHPLRGGQLRPMTSVLAVVSICGSRGIVC